MMYFHEFIEIHNTWNINLNSFKKKNLKENNQKLFI